MWVKGSGGDLGTLTPAGLAVLRLDRLRALVDVYPGVEREDEMVAAFDFCLHGKGGAAPSIDTAMHGLVEAPHVDHLHPDSGIALATAADGEKLTEDVLRRPRGVGAVAASRASSWAWTSRRWRRRTRRPSAWSWAGTGSPRGARPARRRRRTRWRSSPGRRRTWTSTAWRSRSARSCRATSRCPRLSGAPRRPRSSRRSAGWPPPTCAQVGHYTDSDAVLEFLSREKLAPLAELGTSCPDHFLRTKVKPLVVDLPAAASVEEIVARLRELHAAYREDYRRLLRAPRRPGLAADARRRPGHRARARRRACSPSGATSRPPGWRASSTSTRST